MHMVNDHDDCRDVSIKTIKEFMLQPRSKCSIPMLVYSFTRNR